MNHHKKSKEREKYGMQTEIIIMNQAKAAVIYSEECILKDVQSALDFMMSMKYEIHSVARFPTVVGCAG